MRDIKKFGIYERLFNKPVAPLLFPTLLILVGFFILPTIVFFTYSFLASHFYKVEFTFTLENYRRIFSSGIHWKAFSNSLSIGLIAATITTLISYPFAYYLTYRLKKGRNVVLFLVVVSLLGSYLVRVYAWKTILGREGVINSFLMVTGLIEEPLLFLLYSKLAVILTLVHVFLPFTLLPILSSLQNIPSELIEAARDLGHSPARAFQRVTLPLSAGGVLAGFTYTFILSVADYITPQLVGGTTAAMIGLSISNQFVKLGNMGLGSALSFSLLAILIFIVASVRWLTRHIIQGSMVE